MGAWPGFCVVGIGGHARTKLIPAIAANGQMLMGLVSRQPRHALPNAPIFATVEAALAAISPDAAFLIASPPAIHFEQSIAALRVGRDVIVEKPAFLTMAETCKAAEMAQASGAVLVEAFMHRCTRLYSRLLQDWSASRAELSTVDLVFVVPSLPFGTFRNAPEIGASVLYDIGCYPLSLVADLNLPLDGLALSHVERSGAVDELLCITGDCGGIEVSIRIGVADTYENAVTMRGKDSAARYAPFFYGRPGDRTIVRTASGRQPEEETIADLNGFMAMLAVPRAEWAASEPSRIRNMIAVAGCLERLGTELLAKRPHQR